MTLKTIFKTFYQIELEAGSYGEIIANEIDRLPDKIRKELEEWLNKHKDYVIEKLKR